MWVVRKCRPRKHEKGGSTYIHLHINKPDACPPTNQQHDWQMTILEASRTTTRTHPLDDRRDRTYARPDARTRVATPDAAATIVRGSVLPSSLPAMVPVGSAPPAIGEQVVQFVTSFCFRGFEADVSGTTESVPGLLGNPEAVIATTQPAIFDLLIPEQ